ncbi:ankyrin repeat domain-containing protein [Zooshikella ganghwensis]|uniref:Ankyrin repeat domain-containing protein n=1 Tax=Zooshikella ganghwensis TaxID=202772 RepID=A0A4P9VEW2_9GAMM|nr:ankyrin repeat domain-containing protein [Zooshikella ganghwensis]
MEAKDVNNWTPLLAASFIGRLEIVKLLVNQGANIQAKSVVGDTALIIAQRQGHDEIVEYLKSKM